MKGQTEYLPQLRDLMNLSAQLLRKKRIFDELFPACWNVPVEVKVIWIGARNYMRKSCFPRLTWSCEKNHALVRGKLFPHSYI